MSIRQRSKSLKSRDSKLSDTMFQLRVLNGHSRAGESFTSFNDSITRSGNLPLQAGPVTTMQINVGKLCNQSCAHCHVDAGPDRTEVMSKEHLETCLRILQEHSIPVVDLTGGAPELNPHFRWFVQECHSLGVKIIDRCNLTIIESNPRYHDLPGFFARNDVRVISSLPHFSKHRTDRQRGDGVFEDSIKALKRLNDEGYGIDGSGLILDLVYNPSGTFLPSSQQQLESEFRHQLGRKFNIEFNNLLTITNLPISRFLDYLLENDLYEEYMTRLLDAFNPATLDGLMCRNTISVSWDGFLYDCDFNQMLDLRIHNPSNHIDNFDPANLEGRKIIVDQHCYGCTAGSGSSCSGAIL